MTALAVCLALSAAIVFGIAAVNQHRGVRSAMGRDRRHLSVGQVAALLADPSWRRGLVLMTLGTGCHVAALSLAPISLTQPINVLAVPTTIITSAIVTKRRPALLVTIAALAVVVGVAGVVSPLVGVTPGNRPAPGLLGWVGAAVITATVALHLAARRVLSARQHRGPSWLAPMLLAVAGAMNLGSASSTFRLLAQDLSHAQPLPMGAVVALGGFIPIGLAAGSWSLQQAYAAGAASAVTATSSVADPFVAVIIGMAVLGETPILTGPRVIALVAATAIAVAGVISLTRHDNVSDDEPDAPPARSHDPGQLRFLHQRRTIHARLARR